MSNAFQTLAQMFTTPTPPPAPAPAMANGMPVVPPNPANPANPTVPANANPAPAEPKAPMADFQDLFKIDPKSKPAAPEPILTIDPAAISDAASKVDFRQAITPEVMARVKAGGEDGFAAMLEAMNGMAQQTFAKAAQTAAHVAQEAAKRSQEQLRKEFPNAVRNHNLRSSFQENPALSNPAVAPLVAYTTAQFQTKFPKASESELRKMVSDYFDQAGELFASGNADPAKNTPAPFSDKSYDFSNW